MTVESDIWLVALIFAIPALISFYYFTERSRKKQLIKFAEETLIGKLLEGCSKRRRILKHVLNMFAIVLIIVSFARPQWGHVFETVKRNGVDFVIALDTSKSMLAQDIKPDRLIRSKLAIWDLVKQLNGDRVGLVAFAGSAFLQCPLTLDYDAFRQSLEALDTDVIPRGGTDIARAIEEAEQAFSNGENEKVIILITDGEDLEASGILHARKAAERGIVIYSVGVGSEEGELIPIVNEKGEQSFLKDQSGKYVRTKLDAMTLKRIAEATKGFYVPLGHTGQGLEAVYSRGISQLTKTEKEARMHETPIERYQYFLVIALFFLFMEPLIGTRKKG